MRYKLFNKAYRPEDGRPVVYLFCRDEFGNREVFKISKQPYFYTTKKPDINVIGSGKDRIVFDWEPHDVPTINGEKVYKIICQLPNHVVKVREHFKPHYEADILFPDRVLIDKGIRACFKLAGDVMVPVDDFWVPPSVAVVDIETRVPPGMDIRPDIMKPRMIICLTVWINGELYTETATNKAEERRLLNKFIDLIVEHDVDYICGWNVHFDMIGIFRRCELLGVNYSRISPLGYAEVRGTAQGYKAYCAGRTIFDLMAAFKKFFQGKTFDSYALDEIAKNDEFGLGWDYVKFDYVNKMNEHYLDEVAPYNRDDVMKTVGIEQKWQLIRSFDTVRSIVGCSIEDAITPARFIDILMLREYHGKYILPSKVYGRDGIDYGGGFVKQPPRGVFENVIVLDFSAMYPTIIRGYNMSPETIIRGDAKWEDYHEIDKVKFRKEPKGVVPKAFEGLISFRAQMKAQLKEARKAGDKEAIMQCDKTQYALKQLINCIPEDSVVLTKEGIKNIKDVKVGDVVWSVDQKGKFSWKRVIRKIKKYTPELLKIEIGSGHVIRCSAGHHMMVYKGGLVMKEAKDLVVGDLVPVPNQKIDVKGKWNKNSIMNALDLNVDARLYVSKWKGRWKLRTKNFGTGDWNLSAGYNRTYHRKLSLKAVNEVKLKHPEAKLEVATLKGTKIPFTFKRLDMAKFLMWVVTEGCLWEGRLNGYTRVITQFKEQLEDLLNQMNLKWSKHSGNYTICSAPLYEYVKRETKNGKLLPEWVFECDSECAIELLEIAAITDGYISEGYTRLNTSQYELAQQYTKLAALAGVAHRIVTTDGMYHVYLTFSPKTVYGGLALYKIRNVETCEGGVTYDITVEDNHTFVWSSDIGFIVTYQSIYGVFAYTGYRAYTPEVSASTTFVGRRNIKMTIDLCHKLGFKVIYTDTDSVFVIAKEDPVAEGKMLQREINQAFADQAKREGQAVAASVGFEVVYRRVVFIANVVGHKFVPVKKRYAGKVMWEEGQYTDKLIIKGFEYKRSDSALYSRSIQYDLLAMILNGENNTTLRHYLLDLCEEFKSMPLNELAIPQRVTKAFSEYPSEANLRAIIYANKYFGTAYGAGSRVLKFAVKSFPSGFPSKIQVRTKKGYKYYRLKEIVLPDGELPKGWTRDHLDFDKQIEKVIQKKVEKILTSVNLTWSEIVSKQKQEGLYNWMK